MEKNFIERLTKEQVVSLIKSVFGNKVKVDGVNDKEAKILTHAAWSAFAVYNKKSNCLELCVGLQSKKDKEEVDGYLYLYEDHFELKKDANVYYEYVTGEKESEFDTVRLPDKYRKAYVIQMFKIFGEDYKNEYISCLKQKLSQEVEELFENENSLDDENSL